MENINLKKIADIPVLENLDENTHLLAEHNGEYARVSKDKVGGGSGALWLNYDELPDGPAMNGGEAGALFDSIFAAHAANTPVYMKKGDSVLPLVSAVYDPAGYGTHEWSSITFSTARFLYTSSTQYIRIEEVTLTGNNNGDSYRTVDIDTSTILKAD